VRVIRELSKYKTLPDILVIAALMRILERERERERTIDGENIWKSGPVFPDHEAINTSVLMQLGRSRGTNMVLRSSKNQADFAVDMYFPGEARTGGGGGIGPRTLAVRGRRAAAACAWQEAETLSHLPTRASRTASRR
jgi:hypothetical protein